MRKDVMTTNDQIEAAAKAAHNFWGRQGMQSPYPSWEDMNDDIQEVCRREVRVILQAIENTREEQ